MEFEISLGYMRFCFEKQNKTKQSLPDIRADTRSQCALLVPNSLRDSTCSGVWGIFDVYNNPSIDSSDLSWNKAEPDALLPLKKGRKQSKC